MSGTSNAQKVTRAIKAEMKDAYAAKPRIGEVVSVTGSHALIMLDDKEMAADRCNRPQLGAILSIDTGASIVLGLVSAMSVPAPTVDAGSNDLRIVELELIGEFTKPTQKTPCLLYTSPSPRDRTRSRMPSSA